LEAAGVKPIEPISLEEIREAKARIASLVLHTPLIKLNVDSGPVEIYLKLENLQPVGSFKLRGASNALAAADPKTLDHGVYTASAGNMAQALAYAARERAVPCSVVVPENAPQTKLDAIKRYDGTIIKTTYDAWWTVMLEHTYAGVDGLFIHPVCQRHVIAGNGTIGLEILEDLPNVDTVIVPYGGGGLSCGIASAVKAIKPSVQIFAAEVDTAAPLSAALKAGSPQPIDHESSFVDGIGGKSVLPEMWPLAQTLLDGSIVCSLDDIAAAIKRLVERHHIVAEGAGASSLAAAMAGESIGETVVCVISGGNIDASNLCTILSGGVP